jgi:hypothetical protein
LGVSPTFSVLVSEHLALYLWSGKLFNTNLYFVFTKMPCQSGSD